jgi:tripartite-type tricarboxylate transporter receptor subunit TctC
LVTVLMIPKSMPPFLKRLAFSALLAVTCSFGAHAQDFPNKPIRIIVPFPAGGVQDLLARTVGEGLAQRLKQPVVVDNRAGAAGNIGAEVLAKAPADGYTLGILSGVHTANAGFFRKLNYDLEKDFVPVRMLGESGVLFVAGNHAPFRNVPELVAYAKAHPGRVNFGSTTSLTIDLLRTMAGTDITMIAYKGVGDALKDAIGGRIDLVAGPSPALVPLVRDGKVRAIGLASTRALAELPGVKPVAETVPGYDAGMWYGLFAPKGTPAVIVRQLEQQLSQMLKDPAIASRLVTAGVEPAGTVTPAAVATRIQTESARWRAVAARTGNYAN